MELFLFIFVFFYPLFMAIYWVTGAIVFYLRREKRGDTRPKLKTFPKVSILVPCHNEAPCIRDAIIQLARNNYPNYEIIAINDGSTDGTDLILKDLTRDIKRLKIVNLTKNYGKAMALKSGVLASSADFIMCIDADALLDKDALFWMIQHFQESPRVGAVTGNPRVINKHGLLARIQIGEFSAIVGMVKRTQRNIGRLFTVSGVNACFRLAALHDVGYWSSDTVTEDIDISWKLQLRYWDIRYEPKAITWILVPETLRSLWRQRLRWAKGGFEAATRYFRDVFKWRNRRMWVIGIEYWVSLLWCYALMFTVFCWAATNTLPADVWPDGLKIPSLVPKWPGVALALVCLAQFTVGLLIDGLYEKRGLFKYLFWAIWYPAIFWFINALTTVVAVPAIVLTRNKPRHACWVSPARSLLYSPVLLRSRRKKPENRRLFRKIIPQTKKILEFMLMFVSWGLWVYLVTPLLSLIVWGLGTYLFMGTIWTPAGKEMFYSTAGFGMVVIAMWVMLASWIFWNKRKYGKKCKRTTYMPAVSLSAMSQAMKTENVDVNHLRSNRESFLYYDDNDAPVIDTDPIGSRIAFAGNNVVRLAR